MDTIGTTIIAVAVLCVILMMCRADDHLYGHWLAEGDDFCEAADIESMMLFVGRPQYTWRRVLGECTRTCHLIIMDAVNTGLTLTYTVNPFAPCRFTATVTSDEPAWPDVVDV